MEMNEENTQQRQYLRRLKPYQRIQLAFELHDMARSRVAGEIKRRHPDLTNEELREKLNERFMVRLAPLAHHGYLNTNEDHKQVRKDPVR